MKRLHSWSQVYIQSTALFLIYYCWPDRHMVSYVISLLLMFLGSFIFHNQMRILYKFVIDLSQGNAVEILGDMFSILLMGSYLLQLLAIVVVVRTLLAKYEFWQAGLFVFSINLGIGSVNKYKFALIPKGKSTGHVHPV